MTSVREPAWRRVPAGVWLLGLVSLLMDVSSEIIGALLPLYLTQTLMASTVAVGVIEGLAMATAAFTRPIAGMLSDRWRNRKWLAVLGYGLSAAARPLFPLADSVTGIALARLADRVGKGIRGAPRDALVADLSPVETRGASFGVRKALDTVGGVVGPVVAIGLVAATAENLRQVFWAATIPAVLAVVVLAAGIREPEQRTAAASRPVPGWRDVVQLTPSMWAAIGVMSLLTLARFSEAFLTLRAVQSGIAVTWVPLGLVGLHLAYGLASYPAGLWSDRVGRRPLLVAGAVTLVAAHTALGLARTPLNFALGIGLWGLHMGLTQGVLSSLLADVTPAYLRGSAFGAASLVSGAVMLAGNALCGVLWHWRGAEFVFAAAATVSCVATVALLLWRADPPAREGQPVPTSSP